MPHYLFKSFVYAIIENFSFIVFFSFFLNLFVTGKTREIKESVQILLSNCRGGAKAPTFTTGTIKTCACEADHRKDYLSSCHLPNNWVLICSAPKTGQFSPPEILNFEFPPPPPSPL